MFDSALYVILDDLKSKYQTTNDNFLLEDLFQIAIIDLISKGIVTDSTMLNKMQHFWRVQEVVAMVFMSLGMETNSHKSF